MCGRDWGLFEDGMAYFLLLVCLDLTSLEEILLIGSLGSKHPHRCFPGTGIPPEDISLGVFEKFGNHEKN